MRRILSKKNWTALGVFMLSIIIPEILDRVDCSSPELELGIYITGAVIALSLIVWGILPFVFRKHRKKTVKHAIPQRVQLPKTDYTKLDSVSQKEKELIGHMGMRMMGTHGHLDLTGMLSDRANGMELNELMFKPCHICGVIRNQRSRKR